MAINSPVSTLKEISERASVSLFLGKADPGNLQFGFHRKAPKRNVLALIYVTVLVLVQVFHFVYVRNSM